MEGVNGANVTTPTETTPAPYVRLVWAHTHNGYKRGGNNKLRKVPLFYMPDCGAEFGCKYLMRSDFTRIMQGATPDLPADLYERIEPVTVAPAPVGIHAPGGPKLLGSAHWLKGGQS
jgi:hypothetical protein